MNRSVCSVAEVKGGGAHCSRFQWKRLGRLLARETSDGGNGGWCPARPGCGFGQAVPTFSA